MRKKYLYQEILFANSIIVSLVIFFLSGIASAQWVTATGGEDGDGTLPVQQITDGGYSMDSVTPKITIRVSAFPTEGGSIRPSRPSGKIKAFYGQELQFTITPRRGYEIEDVIVDGVSQGPINTYVFTNITQKHSIKARFAIQKFTVMITQGGNVSISPIGMKKVRFGKRIKLKITPNSIDTVPILLVNGQPVDMVKKGNIYKFKLKVRGDTSIHATSAVETKLAPIVKVADDVTLQNLSSISEDKSVLTFNELTPYLESLQLGDVIITGISETTPYGLLRKVTNITINGSQVIVETTNATLEDALEEGLITLNKTLTDSDIMSFVPLMEGVTLQEQGIPGPLGQICVSLHKVLFDYDDDPNTTTDQVIFNGNACIIAGVNLALDIGCCPKLNFFELSGTFGESIDFSFDCRYDFRYSKEIPIAEFYFAAIPVGPLVFVPRLTINVGMAADLVADITAGVSQSSSLTLGFGYDGDNWAPISRSQKDFYLTQLPQFYANASAQAYVRPELGLRLYDVAGGYVYAKGYLGVDMNPFSNPWLSMYAGIQAGVGVDVEIWGFNIIDKKFNLLDYKKSLSELSGNKPPVISSLTANPMLVATGETSTVRMVASDPNGDAFTCVWSTNGGALSTTEGCGPVTWTAPFTPGRYRVSAKADDNKQGHIPYKKGVLIDVLPSNTLTVQKAGDGSGTVRSHDAKIDCGNDCSESYISITPFPRIYLTAYPDIGSALTNWSGCDTSPGNDCNVLMAMDRSVTATFTKQYYMLSVQKLGSGSGAVTGPGIDCGSDCSESLSGEVTLTATPDAGSAFISWIGCYSADGNTCKVRLNENVSIYAKFDKLYTLSVQKTGDGSGTVTGNVRSSTAEVISCGSDCSEILADGTTVILTATPDTGSALTSWSGCDSADGNTCTVWIGQNKTVTANFTKLYKLSIQKEGNGGGTVTGTGIDCGSDCNETLASGTTVTLTPTPGTGSALTSWSGCDSTDGNICTVTMNQNKTITATFSLNQYTLSIQKEGNGGGTVTGTGINCGSDCSESLVYGTTVILTAIPSTGSALTSWSGCDSINGNTCTVNTINQDKTITATFTLDVQNYTLSVQKAGNGSGTVTGGGINCGSDCSKDFADGTTVKITATPSTGSALTSWSGCNSTNGNTCTVTMNQDKTITATFSLNQYTFSVKKGGCGSGTVTGTGINCGSDCSESLAYGTTVTLSAVPDSGSTFARFYRGTNHWASNNVTVNADMTLTALFGLQAYNLCIQPEGNGSGRVYTVDSYAFDCYIDISGAVSGKCAGNLPTTGHYYTTFRAVPDYGSYFDGWTGPCFNTGLQRNQSGDLLYYWCQTIWVGDDGWDVEAFTATFIKD